MAIEVESETRVRAEVNYILNPPPQGAEPLTFVTDATTNRP